MRAELRIIPLLVVVAFVTVGLLAAYGQDVPDKHDHSKHEKAEKPEKGKDVPDKHDHSKHEDAEKTEKPEKGHDDHEGHDDDDGHEEGHDDHEGHDDDEGHDAHEGHDDEDEGAHDDHEGHVHEDEGATDDHEGHDHGDEGATDVHEDEIRVELTPEQRKRAGLKLAEARSGSIDVSSTFPGAIVLNPDRVVHVVPRVEGIVREVKKTLGDRVEVGEILAWIESDELAEAKLDFYAKQADVATCRFNLPRAKDIFENVNRLLVLLKGKPDPKALDALDGREMGEYRGQLLEAYAEYAAARAAHEQEEALRGKQISSERERIEVVAAFEKARAAYIAAKDTARYQIRVDYTEAASHCQVAVFEAAAAERRLRLKGVDDETIRELRALVPETASLKPCVCDEADCKDGEFPAVMDALAKDDRFAWVALRSPMAGFVIEKHLSLGEKADGEESVFAIADTSSVWVLFNVYQKDLASVRPGLKVQVSPGVGAKKRSGVISNLSPIVDEATRTVPARIVMENEDGTLRPGLYATVRVAVGAVKASVVVPMAAIQIVEQREVVFVEDGDGFIAEPVTLGAGDRTHVVVTSGLKPGQRYVVKGAFELKAKLATSGLGAHAGHGH
jgi:membrane fusion protein, heavy metal efflux system